MPLRSRKSNTAAVLFPNSAGNAAVKKSEFARVLLLTIATGPPPVPGTEKWL